MVWKTHQASSSKLIMETKRVNKRTMQIQRNWLSFLAARWRQHPLVNKHRIALDFPATKVAAVLLPAQA